MVENRFVTDTSSIIESSRERHAKPRQSPAEPGPSRPGKSLERSDIESLIAQHYVGLRVLIARRAGNEELAADLLNDAVCTSWEKWQNGHIERPEQIVGYIFQVAMNMLRNHRRAMAERSDKRADAGMLDALASPDSDATQEVEREMGVRVKDLIRSLGSPRDRMVLVRFYLDEEDRQSICREFQLTGAQFARILHRARARLRQLVESRGFKRSDLFSLFAVV